MKLNRIELEKLASLYEQALCATVDMVKAVHLALVGVTPSFVSEEHETAFAMARDLTGSMAVTIPRIISSAKGEAEPAETSKPQRPKVIDFNERKAAMRGHCENRNHTV